MESLTELQNLYLYALEKGPDQDRAKAEFRSACKAAFSHLAPDGWRIGVTPDCAVLFDGEETTGSIFNAEGTSAYMWLESGKVGVHGCTHSATVPMECITALLAVREAVVPCAR